MLKRSQSRRNRVLTDYIDSLGADLPNDYHDFLIGATDQDSCVFCLIDHNREYPVYKIDPHRIIRKDTELFACSDCGMTIDSMIRSHYPEGWLEDRIDGENLSPSYDDAIVERIKGLFDDSSNAGTGSLLYYTRHHPRRDTFIKDRTHQRCYGCNFKFWENPAAARFPIQMPMSQSYYLTGGIINLCAACHSVAKEIIINNSVSVPERVRHSCFFCHETYFTTLEEEKARQENNEIDSDTDRLCPNCAYKQIDNIEEGDWLFLKENAVPRRDAVVRFVVKRCQLCEKSFSLDLTVTINELKFSHRVTGYMIKTLCKECFRDYKDFLEAHPNATVPIKNHVIVFDLDGRVKGYLYQLLNREVKIKKTFTVSPNQSEGSYITEILAQTDNYFYGEQATLWTEKD